MIYRKNANFPYPVLSNTSNAYVKNTFEFDVDVYDISSDYQFNIEIEIDSEYIKKLLTTGKAQLIFIIQSKDNKYFRLTSSQNSVLVKKSRVSLNDKTSLQLHIQTLEDINFKDNFDLNDFYQEFKHEINIPKYSLLGFSNVISLLNIKKPFDLFEKRLDENLNSEIKIELGQETIIINYKKSEFQFNHLPKSNVLNNPYIYTGLTKALQAFIAANSKDGDVDLEDINEPEGTLDWKLYNLMKNKGVTRLNYDNIDEVIHIISNRIIEKYTKALEEMVNNGS
ncbi:hypothetical protein [Fervidibacillus halotolerans]|uniref:Uncharacterized protein n=1 Tax=Fervidibacillus halotolerans TaxID=2980027 RepID=A0A9E8M0Y4_9BACI|nr:hypothetical protein [Fervidibacillus halotolerans]WAA13362.1 hypothetical protein OE105_04400 [Fervidibacillus halotolerans]